MFKRKVIFFWLLTFLLASCATDKPIEEEPGDSKKPLQSTVMDRSYQVLSALKNNKMEKLSTIVHPTKGVLFSPYTTVDKKRAQVFMQGQVKELLKSDKQYEWGTSAGKGEPIRLTSREYFDRYVYDVDFLETDFVTYNDVYKQTNSVQNINDMFPKSNFVEYFVPGSEEFEGMDWKSLKLVFSEYQGEHHLVAIIHDEWTP